MNKFLLKLSGYSTILEKYQALAEDYAKQLNEQNALVKNLEAINGNLNDRITDLTRQRKGVESTLDATLEENVKLKRTLAAKTQELAESAEIVAKYKKIREEHNRARREKRAKAREAKKQQNG